MNFAVFLAALFALYCSVEPKKTSPKVVVYSLNPGEFGKENTLICHVTNFHPPDITIELLKNNVVIPAARLTDLSFKQDWHFHLTKNVDFIPQRGDIYSCKVTHGQETKNFIWESNM